MTTADEQLSHPCRDTCSGWEAGREFGQREQIALEATAAMLGMKAERDAALAEVERLKDYYDKEIKQVYAFARTNTGIGDDREIADHADDWKRILLAALKELCE